nr:hypothetical protein CFP56_30606 [Quercus suber]
MGGTSKKKQFLQKWMIRTRNKKQFLQNLSQIQSLILQNLIQCQLLLLKNQLRQRTSLAPNFGTYSKTAIVQRLKN